jgi:Tfp pilus assembly protein PilN
VILDPTRLAVIPLGDRLVAAVLRRQEAETFTVEAENLAVALRAELDQRKVTKRSVAVGLPRTAAIVKPIELPSVDGQVGEMVKFELERHLPSGADDASFDFLPLQLDREPTETQPARQVLIAATERRVIDGVLRVMEEARLRASSVTVAAHDLLALVSRPRRGRVVWVHRVGEQAELLFLAGSGLVLSRSVPASDAAAVAAEIESSFAIVRWRGCDAVWVSGDTDPLTAGAALGALGAPVIEPPYTSSAQRWLNDIEAPRGAHELAVAVAAAGRTRPLELLPESLRPRRLSRAQLVTMGALAATLLLTVVALLAPGYRESRRLAGINARIATLEPEVRRVEASLKEVERKRRLFTTVQSIETSSVRPLPVLRELTELLPTDAWLTMLALDPKGVELTGQAAAAAVLIPLLENSPRLERVEFASPVTRGREREQFRIRAAWEPPAGAAAAPARPPAEVRPATPRRGSVPPGGGPGR